MENKKSWDVLFLVLGIVSMVIGIIKEEYRSQLVIGTLVIIIILILARFNSDMENIQLDIKKLNEKIDIHRDIIDLKSDVKHLKEKIKNDKKRTN